MVQLTAEQRIFVVKKFYETRNLQATYMEYAFGEALPDWEPPETLDLSPTAQDSRSHSQKKSVFLQNQQAEVCDGCGCGTDGNEGPDEWSD